MQTFYEHFMCLTQSATAGTTARTTATTLGGKAHPCPLGAAGRYRSIHYFTHYGIYVCLWLFRKC